MTTNYSLELDLYKERLTLYNVMLGFVVLNYTKCKSCLRYNINSNWKCKRKDINMKKIGYIGIQCIWNLFWKSNTSLYLQCSGTIQLHNEFLWYDVKYASLGIAQLQKSEGEHRSSELPEEHPQSRAASSTWAATQRPRSLFKFLMEKGLRKVLQNHDLLPSPE